MVGLPKTPKARKRALIASLLAVVVAASVLTAFMISDSTTPKPVDTRSPLPLSSLGAPPANADCDAPVEPKYQGRIKFKPGDTHPPYSSDPPTSGWFLPGAHPGYYELPPSLEEMLAFPANGGAVVWSSQAESKAVRSYAVTAKDQTSLFVKYAPVKEGVIFTAWGVMQHCKRFSGGAFVGFYNFYAQGRALKVAEPTAKPVN